MKHLSPYSFFFALILFSLLFGGCASQYIKVGKEAYKDIRYQDAIWSFEKGLKKKDNPEARRMLAESYLMVNDYASANEQFQLISKYSDNSERDIILQGQSLMAAGKYADARKVFQSVLDKNPKSTIAKSMLDSCDRLEEMKKDSLYHVVSQVNIPSNMPVYSAIPYNDGLIITSPSTKGDADPYTSKAYTDLYFTKKEGSSWSAPSPIEEINGPYHDAVAAVSPDGKTMVFTRSFQLKGGKLGGNEDNVSNTQLYYSKKQDDGKWGPAELVPFSSEKNMFAHPAFTPDGSTLYFASDVSGSGQMDIFSAKLVDGSWGAPQNLGPTINTAGNEVFPTIKKDGTLYFSSDGHHTLGGLDILSSTQSGGNWSTPRHISYPINTASDDFSVAWNPDGVSGYLTSDRSGADRIYSFTILNPKITLEGLVLGKDSSLPLGGARITVMNLTDGTEKVVFTDGDGKFATELEPGKEYRIKSELDGYFTMTDDFSTKGITSDKVIQRVIELGEVYIAGKDDDKTEDPNKGVYPISNIYWDFNKWNIRPDAVPYLNDLVKLFNNNQNLRFEIRSHCDSRGSKEYNDDLSNKRARAVLDYLVKKGVPKDIMDSKGFGERELINGCSDGVFCTEEEHQKNRRTEFVVTDKK